MPNFDTFAGYDMVLPDKVNILGVLFSRAGINFHHPVERLLIESRQRIMLTKSVNVCVCVCFAYFCSAQGISLRSYERIYWSSSFVSPLRHDATCLHSNP